MLGKPINGEMLLLARKKRRLTQSELAKHTRIPQAAISRIENGSRDALPSDQLQALAVSLRFPANFFFEQEPLYRRPISLHGAAFRKKACVGSKDVDAVVASANHYIIQIRRLMEAVDFEPEFDLLQFEVVSAQDSAGEHARAVASATEAARKVRASWQLGDGPVNNLIRYVEASGVIVVDAEFGDVDIDGITLRPAGMRPIIFLNRNRPADRMRFSLAHELGHVVLHPFPYDEMEKEANEFAAELLLPYKGIANDLRRKLTIPYLGALKKKWGASIAALIYRAEKTGAIQNYEALGLRKQMGAFGYRMREPIDFDIPSEPTKLCKELVKAHLDDLGYSIDELAKATLTYPDEFSVMYGLALKSGGQPVRPKLRLVSNHD